MSTCSSWSVTSTMSTKRPGPPMPIWPHARLVVETLSRTATSRRNTRLMLESGIGYTVIRAGMALRNGGAGRVAVHVARAAAITQLRGAVQNVFHGLRMRRGLKVLRMTAAAGSRGCGVRVRYLVRVGGMAGDAA